MIVHCCIDIEYVLRLPASEAGRMLRDPVTKRTLKASEVYAHATILKARGFDAMPTCDHHDARGHCLGHETESA